MSDCADSSYLARWAPTTTGTLRSETGLLRTALTVSGPFLEVVHAALPVGDDLVVTGIASDGTTFAGKRIDRTGVFIARIANDGTLKWYVPHSARRINEIAIGRSGNVLLAGFYNVTTDAAGKSLPAPSRADCFVSALDGDTGAARWFVPFGATQDCEVRSIAADADGNLYVAGDLSGRARFDGSREIDAAARPTMSPFVASWSPSGTLRWVTPGRGTGFARSKGLAVAGDAVVVGTRVTGAGWLGEHELRAGGCVVARLDSSTGAIRWLRELAIVKCELHDVAAHEDRVAAVGRHRGAGAWIEELSLADGTDRWRARLGTHDQVGIKSAAYSSTGGLTVAGYFGGSSLVVGSHTLHGNGNADIFIAGFDASGGVLGALSFGGAGADRPRWIRQGTSPETVLLAGRFANSVIVGTRELRAVGDADGMVLELALPWLDPNSAR